MTVKEYNKTIDLHADGIFRFAVKHLRNEMSANDIVQETYANVWVKHEQISFEKAKSYLFTTAYHAIVDWVKKEKRNGDDFGKTDSIVQDAGFENFDLQNVLNEALDKLPEIQKTVILLRDYEGYNYIEIAKITGLNESQVKVYIFRARKALQEYIKKIDLVV